MCRSVDGQRIRAVGQQEADARQMPAQGMSHESATVQTKGLHRSHDLPLWKQAQLGITSAVMVSAANAICGHLTPLARNCYDRVTAVEVRNRRLTYPNNNW